MENDGNFSFSFHQGRERNQPVVIITELMQLSARMRSVDEVFMWLSHAMVHRLDVPSAQFWTAQSHNADQPRAVLRAATSQNPSISYYVSANPEIAEIVEHLLLEQRSVMPLPVAHIFSSSQADVLAQYGLHYWTASFLKKDILPSSMTHEFTTAQIVIPLSLVTTLFTQQLPTQRLLRAISFMVEQGLRIATSRGFFSVATSEPSIPPNRSNTTPVSPSTLSEQQPTKLTLSNLIPNRTQNIQELQAKNPFASAVVISEKKARRLYAAIDGQKSVAELTHLSRLTQQEVVEALRFLLQHEHIQLCEPGGKSVESSNFLKLS